MKQALIVFYSRTGRTRQIAHQIARRCTADLEDIQLSDERIGWRGYLRSVIESLSGALPRLGPLEHAAGDYELVFIGTPIWTMHVSTPIRAYLARLDGSLPRVAFFCTMGGSGGARAMAQLRTLTDREPVAALTLTDAEIAADQYRAKLGQFVDRATASTQRARVLMSQDA